ncbi:MAG: hypothetical protein Q9O24_03990 [Gammaproteobacteria bacterium]|nr:hypothetical protein [Gammaproteobacteria bacterium]
MNDLTYEQLQKKYAALQKRLNRFSLIQQDLITLHQKLDRELVRFTAIQHYNTQALLSDTLSDFAARTAEAVVDVFELEFGLLWLLSDQQLDPTPSGIEGLQLHQWQAIKNWLETELSDTRLASGLILDTKQLQQLEVSAQLNQLIIYPCRIQNELLGYLLTGVTTQNADFYDPKQMENLDAFNVFGQQVSCVTEKPLRQRPDPKTDGVDSTL